MTGVAFVLVSMTIFIGAVLIDSFYNLFKQNHQK